MKNLRFHAVNAVLLATLLGGSLLAWPLLPESIPAHIGPGGEVRWEASSFWEWMLLPLIALATLALTYGSAAALPRRPALFNIPEKAAFLALPPEGRAPVIVRMRAMLYGISAVTLVVFGVLQWMRWHMARGGDPTLLIAVSLGIGFMTAPIALGVWLPPISREIREQTRRSR